MSLIVYENQHVVEDAINLKYVGHILFTGGTCQSIFKSASKKLEVLSKRLAKVIAILELVGCLRKIDFIVFYNAIQLKLFIKLLYRLKVTGLNLNKGHNGLVSS